MVDPFARSGVVGTPEEGRLVMTVRIFICLTILTFATVLVGACVAYFQLPIYIATLTSIPIGIALALLSYK
jgi:hypothetical protein